MRPRQLAAEEALAMCRHLQAPSLPPRGYARNQWEQRTPEARVRPQTAMPAVTTEDGMHMPFIPER